jgi:hypothetical protein
MQEQEIMVAEDVAVEATEEVVTNSTSGSVWKKILVGASIVGGIYLIRKGVKFVGTKIEEAKAKKAEKKATKKETFHSEIFDEEVEVSEDDISEE